MAISHQPLEGHNHILNGSNSSLCLRQQLPNLFNVKGKVRAALQNLVNGSGQVNVACLELFAA